MACFMTQMSLKMSNTEDFKIAKEWSEHLNENAKIKVFEPEIILDKLEISDNELDIDVDEARDVFKSFARYAISNGILGEVEVYFCVAPDNYGEETHLLFKLKDGKATEQYAYVDFSDDYDYDEEDEDDEDEFEDWSSDPEPEYGPPRSVKL